MNNLLTILSLSAMLVNADVRLAFKDQKGVKKAKTAFRIPSTFGYNGIIQQKVDLLQG